MKRSRISTFKIKKSPKNEYTRKFYNIGDYFTIDFDKCLMDLENYGSIFIIVEQGDNCIIFPDEILLIRVSYIDKYDVDFDNELIELKKYLK